MSILFFMVAAALCLSVEDALGNWIKWLHRPRVLFNRGGRYKFN